MTPWPIAVVRAAVDAAGGSLLQAPTPGRWLIAPHFALSEPFEAPVPWPARSDAAADALLQRLLSMTARAPVVNARVSIDADGHPTDVAYVVDGTAIRVAMPYARVLTLCQRVLAIVRSDRPVTHWPLVGLHEDRDVALVWPLV